MEGPLELEKNPELDAQAASGDAASSATEGIEVEAIVDKDLRHINARIRLILHLTLKSPCLSATSPHLGKLECLARTSTSKDLSFEELFAFARVEVLRNDTVLDLLNRLEYDLRLKDNDKHDFTDWISLDNMVYGYKKPLVHQALMANLRNCKTAA